MMRSTLIALFAAGCSLLAAAGVPLHVPASPDAVLLRIPAAAAPVGSKPADDVRTRADALMALGSQSGEERYFGLAEQLIDHAPSPQRKALHLMKARLLQHRHAFDDALHVLDELLIEQPRSVEARLMRAQILVQQMRSGEAMRDCAALQSQVSLLVFATCAAQARAGLGDLRGAYALVQVALTQATSTGSSSEPDAIRSWSAGVAGELALRLGDEAAAGSWYEQAWRSGGDNHFARLNYADWLLERQRHAEAAAVVAQYRSPADRLRQVLAARDTGSAQAARLRLAWDEATARGETAHLLDLARYTWELTSHRREALAQARAAFTQRHDADSARLVFRMAEALNDDAARNEVQRWRQSTGYVDRRLQ
jgi:predicted Zn-dependent protease